MVNTQQVNKKITVQVSLVTVPSLLHVIVFELVSVICGGLHFLFGTQWLKTYETMILY